MKVVDKTPFLNEKGKFGAWQRFQGILEYGNAWPAEVEAQPPIVTQLDRVLEKGFTLIRNLNLEHSRIIEPLVLIGPPGVFVLYVTPVSGFFEAKGDEWNVIKNDGRTPAPINLMVRVTRLARAVQVFLHRQGVYLPGLPEPVLIAANPGVHIESLRPIVRVVLSDGVKQFGASILQAPPILKPDSILEIVDHLLNPRPRAGPAKAQPAPEPVATFEELEAQAPAAQHRARRIFQAAEETKPFDPADLSFEFDEHGTTDLPAGTLETSPAQPLSRVAPRRGFSPGQWLFLVVLGLIEFVVLAGFVYMLLFASA